MRKQFLLLTLLTCLPLSGMADPVIYHVSVDTSSLSGTTGSIDFNFNPGPLTSQSATVQILNFTSDGSLGTSAVTGDVSGTLPAVITLNNDTPFNDYFSTFTFGDPMDFDISLFGAALSAPDGTSNSGSTFAFSLFSDPEGTQPALSSDTVNGFGYTVEVNLDGTTTATNYLTNGSPTNPTVPEPPGLIMLVTGLVAGLAPRLKNLRCVPHS